jgi:hypothetical protein
MVVGVDVSALCMNPLALVIYLIQLSYTWVSVSLLKSNCLASLKKEYTENSSSPDILNPALFMMRHPVRSRSPHPIFVHW